MESRDVIIIGAGAAGLMCARELLRAGFSVSILEARNRMGGKIHTLSNGNFPMPVELGAEFIHGDLEETKNLLREAGINFYEVKGELWRLEKGQFIEQEDFIEDIDKVIERLKKLPSDMAVADFLQQNFADEKWVGLRHTLKSYVEGYDAADVKLASAFALLTELIGADEKQYRVEGGYSGIIDFLAAECKKGVCDIHLEKIVTRIEWKKSQVQVIDRTGDVFEGRKVVVTIPLGVLQSPVGSEGQVTFSPAIAGVRSALNRLGNGKVIKISLSFDHPVWTEAENLSGSQRKSYPGFVFSDALIPTWWTQFPKKNGMFTGWMGGTKAARHENEPDEKLLRLALESLAVIFQLPRKAIESKLLGYGIHNWATDVFAKGGYSYETVHSKNAKTIISEGVDGTLYFAGEAYYAGPESGTVEAALVSGIEIAKKISGK